MLVRMAPDIPFFRLSPNGAPPCKSIKKYQY
nr:MAG TPA: hypothetical protein [Caudoviricetes sp.]